MSIVRFCADLHFEHKNLAQHRGFQDEFYHDEHIIDMWNRNIHKKDVTYILGDISMEKKNAYPILNRLNGRKIVVLGNHDKPQHVEALLKYKYVDKVAGMIKYSQKQYTQSFWLTHCPIHPSELRDCINIHGHIHEEIINDPNYICVSMEQIDYTPRTLDYLLNQKK